MKTKFVNLLVLILTIGALTISCKKMDMRDVAPNKPIIPPHPTNTEVTLMGSVGENKGVLGLIQSNSTVNGDISYFFKFWLNPSDTTEIAKAKGIYVIMNPDGITEFYRSSSIENCINKKFPTTGRYIMSVSGNYNNIPFSYVNITINVTENVTPPNNTNTAPVGVKGLYANTTNTTLSLAISRAEYSTLVGKTWFYVAKVNGTNFVHVTAPLINDSVVFSIAIPTASGITTVEFNGGYEDGSNGGMWFTASNGSPNILYPGTGSFWKITIENNGSTITAKAPNGTVLVTISAPGVTNPIPGNNGDDLAHQYTVRWSGYKHFLKFTGTNFCCQYKVGAASTTWTTLTGTTNLSNPEYQDVLFPSVTGEIHYRYGALIAGVFYPSANMTNSMFYYNGELVENI